MEWSECNITAAERNEENELKGLQRNERNDVIKGIRNTRRMHTMEKEREHVARRRGGGWHYAAVHRVRELLPK